MAGVAVQLTLLPTRCTVCRPRAPAGQTGPALPAVVRELAGGTAGSAVAGEEGGLAVTGETELAVPAVLTVRAAAQTLQPGGVEPVTRATLLHTHSRLAEKHSDHLISYCRLQAVLTCRKYLGWQE